jgi:hypothetical protein
VRERAFSDLADAAGGAARINNIGITHGFLLKHLVVTRVGESLRYW